MESGGGGGGGEEEGRMHCSVVASLELPLIDQTHPNIFLINKKK